MENFHLIIVSDCFFICHKINTKKSKNQIVLFFSNQNFLTMHTVLVLKPIKDYWLEFLLLV